MAALKAVAPATHKSATMGGFIGAILGLVLGFIIHHERLAGISEMVREAPDGCCCIDIINMSAIFVVLVGALVYGGVGFAVGTGVGASLGKDGPRQ